MDIPIFRRRCWFLIRPWIPLIFVLVLSVTWIDSVFASSNGHETKGWVSTDSYRVLNFAVLAVGIFFAVRKPVSKSLNDRVKEIRNNLEDLESQKKSVQAELVKYDSRLAGLDEETKQIVGEYVEQAKKAKDKILNEAEGTAEKMRQQVKSNIEYEFEQARNKLRHEVVDKALIKAEAIIKEKISEDDQEKLIDEYLEEVVA